MRLAAWVLIATAVVYLVVVGGGGYGGLYATEFRITSTVVAATAILIWLAWSIRHPEWRPRSAIGPTIGAVLFAIALGTITGVRPRFGYDYVAYGVLLAGLYLLLQRLFAHEFFVGRIATFAILLGFFLTIAYHVAVTSHWLAFWQEIGHFSTPPLRPRFEGLAFGNPSAVATVTILLWLAAAAHLGFAQGRDRATLIALGILTTSVVFLSGSRGAWAGLAVTAVTVVPLWFIDRRHRAQVRGVLHSPRIRAALAIVTVAGAGVAVLFAPALLSRLAEPASDTRTAFYAASIRMFLERPLTGLGTGAWTVERIRYTIPPDLDYYIPHAHNVFLQTLAELGLVGVIAGIVAFVSVASLLKDAIRSEDPTRMRFAWAGVVGLVYLAAHQLFDFYMNMPAVGFCLALVIARLDALAPRQRVPTTRRGSTVAMVLLIVATIGSVLWLAPSEGAAQWEDRAVAAANSGDWAGSLDAADHARAADPQYPPYLFTSGLAAAHVGDLTRGRDLLLASAQIDDLPTAWLDVARLDIDLGDNESAGRALANSMRLGYQQPEVAIGAATLWIEMGLPERATEAMARAFMLAPGLASDPTLGRPPFDSILSPAADAALLEAPAAVAYQIALEDGRIEAADALAASLDGPDRELARLEVAAWSGDESAFARLHDLAVADPLDDVLVARCRRVAARSHDADWTGPGPWDCDGAGKPAHPTIVRVAGSPTERAYLPGANSSWHFHYVYRREVPFDELVPGLPHLESVIP